MSLRDYLRNYRAAQRTRPQAPSCKTVSAARWFHSVADAQKDGSRLSEQDYHGHFFRYRADSYFMLHRTLNRSGGIRPQEASAVLLGFAYFFCLLCSYYLLRPLRDAMGLVGGIGKL